jgi:ferrochelatase
MRRTGVLVTAFGGPRSLDEVEPFLARLIGHEPSQDSIEGSVRKYEEIGGRSPLPGIVQEIAEMLEAALAGRGLDMPVRMGLRYSDPSVADAISGLIDEGVSTMVTVSLPCFESDYTTRSYREAIAEAMQAHPGLEAVEAPAYHTHPGLVTVLADAVTAALAELSDADRAIVIFTAHSLPLPEIQEDDTYVRQLKETMKAVAAEAGTGVPTLLAYQSRGRQGSEWLGPDLSEMIAAASMSLKGVAVCPIGFATDHLETLYDLDIVARRQAEEVGLGFARGAVPNTDPRMIETLVETVLSVLPGEGDSAG